MAPFTMSIDIDRPVPTVFAYLGDVSNEIHWQSGLLEAGLTSAPPLGVGSTGRDVRTSMGRRVVNEWEVTGLRENEMFEFRVTKPVAFTASYTFEATPAGSRLTMTARPDSALTRIIWPLFTSMGKKQYGADFARLKQVLEAS